MSFSNISSQRLTLYKTNIFVLKLNIGVRCAEIYMPSWVYVWLLLKNKPELVWVGVFLISLGTVFESLEEPTADWHFRLCLFFSNVPDNGIREQCEHICFFVLVSEWINNFLFRHMSLHLWYIYICIYKYICMYTIYLCVWKPQN